MYCFKLNDLAMFKKKGQRAIRLRRRWGVAPTPRYRQGLLIKDGKRVRQLEGLRWVGTKRGASHHVYTNGQKSMAPSA